VASASRKGSWSGTPETVESAPSESPRYLAPVGTAGSAERVARDLRGSPTIVRLAGRVRTRLFGCPDKAADQNGRGVAPLVSQLAREDSVKFLVPALQARKLAVDGSQLPVEAAVVC